MDRMIQKHFFSLPLWLLVALTGAQSAEAAVDNVCDLSFQIDQGNDTLFLSYCGNLSLDFGDAGFDRAIIVIHGTNRNADDYMAYVEDAGIYADNADLTTAIIAPQFLTDQDVAAFNLPSDQLYWSSGGWKKGNTSNSDPYSRPFNISSFTVVDLLISRLVEYQAFPNISEIVIVGHSAGGQFVHRYAAGGNAQADLAITQPELPFRYIVANPSSYLYFSQERAKGDKFSKPKGNGCPEWDDYKYGLKDKNGFMTAVGNEALKQRYSSRRVNIMLGENDNNPNDSSMDDGCEANLQGEHRLQRGEIFFNHAMDYFGSPILDHQTVEVVSGVGHSGRQMFQSDCGLALLYHFDPDGTACAGADDDGGNGNGKGGGKGKN
jgi:pimeloyl-ACP methyl ester carboxylesterase